MKLLHLDSSILGENSVSRSVSAAVAAQLKAAHPGLEETYRDLVAAPLPHLTLEALADPTHVDEFLAADVVVIGAAMYNFALPTQLKAWIDRILIAGKTFRYTEAGPEGLAGGKRVIVALARGGNYGSGSPAAAMEHAETYLRGVFGFIGVTDLEFIIAEGIALGPDQRQAALAGALAAANTVAPLRKAA
ncbi:MAG TPA: NAD(P)H-dependent oxidoreductase [Caulobacteraceae bacterium]|jgi:FMN-dependent NADH-azoreductase